LSNLQRILLAATEGLALGQQIPSSRWPVIAEQCGTEEVTEIRSRITQLQQELAQVEEWDGDTQDDINGAIYAFEQVILLCERRATRVQRGRGNSNDETLGTSLERTRGR
jgi:hypothetical protein